MKSRNVLLGALVVCTAGVQASSDFKNPANSKKGIDERAIRRNQLEMQKATELVDTLVKAQKDEESLFENSPHDYFGMVSFSAKQLVKLYDDFAPINEHVEAIKLYALMYEAFGNAAKGKDKFDHKLLNDAHSKVSDLIRLAEYLIEYRKSLIEEHTFEMNSSK